MENTYAIKRYFYFTDNYLEPGNAILEKTSGIVKVGIDIGMNRLKKAIIE